LTGGTLLLVPCCREAATKNKNFGLWVAGATHVRNETASLYGYTEDRALEFESTRTSFHVVLKNMNYNLHGDLDGTTMQVTIQVDRFTSLLEYCTFPRTREEMQKHLAMANRDYFRKSVLKPLLESGQLVMTIPDKPNSRNQKYVRK
jgi:ATP-dependent DNA helicase RecG